MDVRLPNGKVIKNIPEGTSKDVIAQRAIAAGLAAAQDFDILPTQGVRSDSAIADEFARPDIAPPDTAAQDALDVGGEFAGGVNRAVMWAPDVLTKATVGGLRGISELAQGNTLADAVQAIRNAPDLSDAIKLAGGLITPELAHRPGEGDFMDPGLARDIVSAAGETAGAGLMAGGAMRETARRLPSALPSEGVASGVLREAARTTPAQDVAYGALSGAGAEIGEEVGGVPGRTVGAFVAPVTGSLSASAIAKAPLKSAHADMARRWKEFSDIGADPTVAQLTDSDLLKGIETLSSKYLGGGKINQALARTTQAAKNTLQRMADDVSGVKGAEAAGRVIQKGITGTGGFVDRFLAKSGALWRSVDDALSGQNVPVTNTRNTLDKLVSDSEFARILNDPKVAQIKAAFDDMGEFTNVPYSELKQLRSVIGEKLGSKDLISDIPRAQLKRLYGAITQDIEGLALLSGDDVAKAYTRANNYTRSGHKRLDDFVERIAGKVDLDRIYAAVTRGGEGSGVINSFKRSLKQDEWEAVVSNVMRRIGRARPGQQNDLGEVFSLPRFLTEWDRLGPAKKALFSGSDKLNQYSKDLNTVASVANSVKQDLQAMANPSGTAQAAANIGTGVGMAAAIATGNVPAAIAFVAAVAANNGAARLMTNPSFVRWLATAAKAKPPQIPGAIAALSKVADRQPEIAAEIYDLTSYLESAIQDRTESQ
jgi:hypothetical protein